jgi:SAM-dependent methyltransferase
VTGGAESTARQRWDPEGYARHARFVSELGAALIEWLAPRPGERVLDLGCGDGALSRRLVEAGCEVVGVDGSAEQVAAARAAGIDARVGDGERLAFAPEFDAVFSNAALHWMKRPDAVIAGVARALRPGGRFVAELGGHGCVDAIRRALHAALARRGVDPLGVDPWYFPTPEEYAGRLAAHGFAVERILLFPRPTPLPGDVEGWLETFAQCFTAALRPAGRGAFLAEVREALRPVLCSPAAGGGGAVWTADYVRLRFAARLPQGEPARRRGP